MFETYLAEIFEEIWLEAHATQLRSQELTLDCLILVFGDLVWVFEVDLLDQLPDEILVEVCAELLRKLSNAKNIIIKDRLNTRWLRSLILPS